MQVIAKHGVDGIGSPEQGCTYVHRGKQGDAQQRVGQGHAGAECLLKKLRDGHDPVFQIDGHKDKRGHENANNRIDLEIGLCQAVQVRRAHHSEKMAGVNVRADRGHGDGGPPQAPRAEKILVHGDAFRLAPRPKADDQNDEEIASDNDSVDHGDPFLDDGVKMPKCRLPWLFLSKKT